MLSPGQLGGLLRAGGGFSLLQRCVDPEHERGLTHANLVTRPQGLLAPDPLSVQKRPVAGVQVADAPA